MEFRVEQRTADLAKALHDLQQVQLHLVQSEKMSSLGQLVAGVAHEINNPVNFIYGNLSYANEYIQDLLRLVQLYQQRYPNPLTEITGEADRIDLEFLMQDLPKLLDSMRVGAERIQQIVASLRTFSRVDEAEMKDVSLHAGIDSTLMILQSLVIEIADNGLGIAQTTQNRLFDPFFTTKAIGKGTGLGLSISYQIVTERHGGSLHCQSAPGQGNRFMIKIPTFQTQKLEKATLEAENRSC